jgi:phosphohistidine phosphatase
MVATNNERVKWRRTEASGNGHGRQPAEDCVSRPLTQAGRLAVERIAGWAAAADIRPDEIAHSGKLRAEQTAEILADYLMPAKGSTMRRGLGPDDDVRPLAVHWPPRIER